MDHPHSEPGLRRLATPSALLATVASLVAAAAVLGGTGSASGATRIVPSCTPQLVYTFRPGNVDIAGSGTGYAPSLRYTDARGNSLPATGATVEWDARAIAAMPNRPVGAEPRLGGWLDFVVTTDAGERITFTATCIAGAGGFGPHPNEWIILYANGTTTGWPGAEVKRTFVHFEAWREGDGVGSYVALIDGKDCSLNFDAHVVTEAPYAVGTGDFTGAPSGFVYSETDCRRWYGNPIPATLAPGRQ